MQGFVGKKTILLPQKGIEQITFSTEVYFSKSCIFTDLSIYLCVFRSTCFLPSFFLPLPSSQWKVIGMITWTE